jgi:hypothetical protein
MSATVTINFAEVSRLATALATLPERAALGARAVVQRGALNIKMDWKQRWAGHPHFPSLPAAITYDTRQAGPVIDAEIGVVKSRRQGGLGNIIEFGTRKNSPIPGGLPALQAELPRFEAAIIALATREP